MTACLVSVWILQGIVGVVNAGGFAWAIVKYRKAFQVVNPPPFSSSHDADAFLAAIGWAIGLPWLNFILWYTPFYLLLRAPRLLRGVGLDGVSEEELSAVVAECRGDLPPWTDWSPPPRWSWVRKDVMVAVDEPVDISDVSLRLEHTVPVRLRAYRTALASMAMVFLAFALTSCVVGVVGPASIGACGALYLIELRHRIEHQAVAAGLSASVDRIFYDVATVPMVAMGLWAIQFTVLAVIALRFGRALRHSASALPIVAFVLSLGGCLALLVLSLLTTSAIPERARIPDALRSRGFCFRNSCDATIRVGQTGGSTGIGCGTGCPHGTVCNPNDDFCYFDLAIAPSSLVLGPGGQYCHEFGFPPITTAVHPVTGVKHPVVQWSGALYASSGCSGDACATAICHDCTAYQGPVGPVTQAEMTLAPDDLDFYDVTIINGANLPLKIVPMSPTGVFAPDPQTPAAYHCGSPGDPNGVGGAPGSTWKFSIPASSSANRTLLPLVAASAASPRCSSDSDCHAGHVCGTAMATIAGGTLPENFVINGRCGPAIGVWSRDELCGWTDAIGFNDCKDTVPVPGESWNDDGTVEKLLQCNKPFGKSCFQNGAIDSCCGCSTWGDFIPTATKNCVSTNPTWEQYAKPHIEVLKRACPTCYSYPYDDPTSTFTCYSNATDNKNSYLIEWCPNGVQITV